MAPKRALSARKQYADRPDGNAEGRGNLRVRVPGMAQQQALALSFRNLGQRLSHSRALFLADQHARRATHIVVGRLVISALQASDAIDARACTPGRAQAIERQVQADPPQPGADFGVGSRLQGLVVGELEEGFLKRVLGLHAVAEDAVHESVELWVEVREQGFESCRLRAVEGRHLLFNVQHAEIPSVVAIHRQNTTASDSLTVATNVQCQRWIRPILGQVPEITSERRMCVRVRLFASYREAAGTARLEVPLPDGARVSDLVDVLAARLPAVRTAPGMVAVNHTYVGADFTLHDGDEAAFIPPVSGGR